MQRLLLLLCWFIIACHSTTHKQPATIVDTLDKSLSTIQKTNTPATNTNNEAYAEQLAYIQENPYADNFDTALKGGYTITYAFNAEEQFLLYTKGATMIDTIGSGSLGLPYKNLGYVAADFDKCFVWLRSYGKGNPHYLSVLNKETAQNLMPNAVAFIDVDQQNQLLLYAEKDIPQPSDSMVLLHIKTMQETKHPFPQDVFDGPQVNNRIKLLAVTPNTFTIAYDVASGNTQRKRTYLYK